MIPCDEDTQAENMQYLSDFAAKSAKYRVPLYGTLDLTHLCNLKCVHCYTGDRFRDNHQIDMDISRIRTLLDEISDAGCLYLLLTGGEPLIRTDFPDIYRYAREKGMIITIFSNGTLISDSIISLFKELPPRMVEISLYGASEPTYEKVTGIKGSFRKCIDGIEKLRKNSINVRLKTVLMTLNSDEFEAIENFAASLDIKFRFDAAIFPRLNGDRSPLDLRVSPSEAIDKEFNDISRAEQWSKLISKYADGPVSDNLYRCAAGVTGFYVAPSGHLHPCVMTTAISSDIQNNGFLKSWDEITDIISSKKSESSSSCLSCRKRLYCGYCPAFFQLENGSEQYPSDYLCKMGDLRESRVDNILLRGAQYGQ